MLSNIFEMKKLIALSVFLILSLTFKAQNGKKMPPPSDVTHGFTYDFDKANQLIIDRLMNPNAGNEDAKVIVEHNSFPKSKKAKMIDDEYKRTIANWIQSNPDLIISTFKHRKNIVQAF